MIQRLIQKYREAFSGVPRNVWLIALVLLVSRSGTMVLPFLAIYCRSELGFEPSQIGWLLASYGIGSVIAGLLGGQMTQLIGAIPTQIISLVMAIPGFLIVGYMTDFVGLACSLVYLSMSVELMRPACTTATVEFCKSESQHTKAFAVNRLAVNIGMTLGPAIGGFLTLFSYKYLFYANSASTCGALFLMLYCFGWKHSMPSEASPDNSEKLESNPVAQSPFRDKQFLLFCFFNCLAACVLFQFLGTYPLYLKEHYLFEEYQLGLLYAVNTIVIVTFELLLVAAIAKFSILRTLAFGQLLSCLGFGMLPLMVGFPFWVGASYCAVAMLVLTLGEMLTSPLGPAYAAKLSTTANIGQYMGMYVTSFSIAVLVAPVGGMWLYEQNPHSVWYISIGIGAIVYLGLMYLARQSETN